MGFMRENSLATQGATSERGWHVNVYKSLHYPLALVLWGSPKTVDENCHFRIKQWVQHSRGVLLHIMLGCVTKHRNVIMPTMFHTDKGLLSMHGYFLGTLDKEFRLAIKEAILLPFLIFQLFLDDLKKVFGASYLPTGRAECSVGVH
jgi:hypothetical protein